MPPLYPVQSPIKHDGDFYTEGDIELTEAQAAPLLAVGAIGPAHAAPAEPKVDTVVRDALAHAKVADAVAALSELTDEQRAEALTIEQAAKKPRAGVVKALGGDT